MANQSHKTVENSCSILPFVVVAIVPFSPWRLTKGTCFDPKLPRSSWGEAGRCRARRRSGNLAAQHSAFHVTKKIALEDEAHVLKRGFWSKDNIICICLLCKMVRKHNLFGWRGCYQSSNSSAISTDSLTEPQTNSGWINTHMETCVYHCLSMFILRHWFHDMCLSLQDRYSINLA